MSGEVLDAAYDTRILQTLQIVGDHRCSHLRVVTEGTGTDNDVVRVGVYIGYRCKVDIKTVVLQIGADGVATLVGILRVACRTDGGHRFVFLDVEVGVISKS